jgi:hypothetical protein
MKFCCAEVRYPDRPIALEARRTPFPAPSQA